MRASHICLLAFLTFCWIWTLPLLCMGIMFSIPVALFLFPTCICVSVVLQYLHHGRIMVDSSFRQLFSSIPWHEWFPCNTVNVHEVSVIAVHPHGLLCCGALAGIHFVPGANTVFAVAPILFYVPVIGWMIRLLGCIPATYDIMLEALRRKHSVIVMPGGVPEIVLSESGDDSRWFLEKRRGFLRLASDASVPILVVGVVGECATYSRILGPCLKERTYISWRTNIPCTIPLFFGWYGTWIPKRTPLQLRTVRMLAPRKADYITCLKQMFINI